MEIVQFRITDNDFKNFLRLNSHSYDCVINALELLGVLQAGEAAIARILTSEGVAGEQIDKIFNTHIKLRQGRGYENKLIATDNPEEFLSTLQSQLKPGHVSFCVWRKRDVRNGKSVDWSHAFMVGRYTNGTVVIIDPQSFRNGYTENIQGQAADKFFAQTYRWGIMFKVPSKETRKRTRGVADPGVLVALRKSKAGESQPIVKKARKV